MNFCLRSFSSCFITLVWISTVVLAASTVSDKSAKDEPTPAANAKTAKENLPPAAKPAKEEPPPAAKPAKEEPASPAAAVDKPAKEDKSEKAEAAPKPKKEEPAAAAPAPPTHTVKREPFKIQFEIAGFFESRDKSEIILRPEEWTSFIVKEAAEHGTRVKKGDVLLEFDSEKIDKAIEDLRAERKISELTLKLVEDQLSVLEKTTPMDLDASRRAKRIADEDQKNYLEIIKPTTIKSLDKYQKFYRQFSDYSRQELEQLEKMYKADDLTEETEKLVLQRARDTLERNEFMLEQFEVHRDQTLKYQIPRMDEQTKETTERRTLAWNKDQIQLPLTLEKQRLEAARQKMQFARSEERLKNLLADQELMKIKATTDGYVYYGRCQRGRFGEIMSMGETLRRGGNAQPNQVLMTVVEPRPIFIHSTISEERLQYVRNGLDGRASPAGYPDIKLDVTVDEVGKIPVSIGSYDLQLSLALEEQPPKVILPGMACEIKFKPYSKSDVLVVPPKCVMTDPLDDEKRFVYLLTEKGKTEKQDVTVGKQTDKQIEILKGLSEGDKILLEAPKEGK